MTDPDVAEYQEFQAWKKAQAAAAAAEEAANKPTEFYVHLADGTTQVLSEEESAASHVDGVQVIARYLVGA